MKTKELYSLLYEIGVTGSEIFDEWQLFEEENPKPEKSITEGYDGTEIADKIITSEQWENIEVFTQETKKRAELILKQIMVIENENPNNVK